jgi:hypothetical protein
MNSKRTSRRRLIRSLTTAVGLLCLSIPAWADTQFAAPGNFNPIVPGYFADPTMEKFGDTFYLYATTDGNGGGRGPATVWVSKDFVNWTLVPMNWPTTPFYWAPDVIKRPDGHYYLFYNQPCNTFAGVSDSPIGPWTPVTPEDGLVIKDHLVKDVITLDTQLFEDKDGSVYGYWGTWGIFPNSGCGFGVFNPDMKSFSKLGMIPNTQAKDFFEGPFMLERNGVYYFTYSSGSCHDASYRVQYAVGSKPDGEFKMGPNNPILATSPDGTIHGPGHHSIIQQGDDYYIIYHRHDIPVTPNGMHRQTCADRLVFSTDGEIKKVEPTHQGVGYLGPKTRPANLALGKPVTASSYYHDTLRKHDYKPEYAVDDNNATLWRPADNLMGNWLQVDMGSPTRVRRTQTQFEYATWYYQYLIEASLDGKNWKVFADRRNNTRWGSPMVDDGDIEARYLRITVTGTEYPGLFGAIWNFKAFSEAQPDTLLAMADKAFAEVVVPTQKAASVAPAGAEKKATGASSGNLLIHLDVAELQLGTPVSAWTNLGQLAGEFKSGDAKPIVSMAAGRKALRFSGKQILTASFESPRSLAGNSSFTFASWVNNPEIGESECILSWAGRGGPDAATAQFGYGTHPEFGAVGHWGFADMGFRGGPPKTGQWHHLAVVFDGVIERVYVDGQLNNSRAKMLMMHQGRPVYVGASEPRTEFFDGYIASIRVYDAALNELAIKQLADDPPSADVLVHLDSAKLDYGPLTAWDNSGSLGGCFSADSKPPKVEEVNGRIAVRFVPGESMRFSLGTDPMPCSELTVLVTVATTGSSAEHGALELEGTDGKWTGLPTTPSTGSWQQVALVCRDGHGVLHRNGEPTSTSIPVPMRIKSVRLGGSHLFTGALSRVQLFRRALYSAEVSQLHSVWKSEWQQPRPSPATFSRKPVALNATCVAMLATRGQSELGTVEYRFTERAESGANRSGWISTPFFLRDGLQPNTRYSYSVAMRDPFGNVSETSQPIETVTDPGLFQTFADKFESARDFLAQGTSGTIWDGVLGKADDSAPEQILAGDGVVRLQSKGTVWDGGKPLGAFLFKLVPGNFVAQVEVADYAGLETRKVPGNNDGGLMVRVPNVNGAGPGEDLVQLNFFPIWNQGNMVTSLDGGRLQKGNQLAWNAHRYLQIIRQGKLFYFRTSVDGKDWKEMPGSPVEREDMAGLPLQVGLYHASYGGDSSHVSFTDFQLTVRK